MPPSIVRVAPPAPSPSQAESPALVDDYGKACLWQLLLLTTRRPKGGLHRKSSTWQMTKVPLNGTYGLRLFGQHTTCICAALRTERWRRVMCNSFRVETTNDENEYRLHSMPSPSFAVAAPLVLNGYAIVCFTVSRVMVPV